MSASPLVRFGIFEFDLASGELRREGRRIRLQSQPAQVLAQLVRMPGEVVTRDALRRTLWADDTFVDVDAALNVAVKKIRKALGDSASAPRFVETLPKRGYRFLADVHPAASEPASARASAAAAPMPAPPEPAPRRRPRWLWVTGFAMAGVALLVILGARRPEPPAASMRSLAVLPFRPLVSKMPDDTLQMALAEAVIVKLGQLRQLRVPSIHAVQHYGNGDTDARAAGRALGVDAVLEGTLLRRDGTVRLTARLIEVKHGTSLWAGQWDVPWTDIFTLQDRIATEVTGALAVRLDEDEQARLRRRPTNLAAYDSYLRGRSLMLRLTAEDSRRAIERLDEAVRLDPRSSQAYATLSFAYIMVGIFEGPREPYATLSRRAADRARELDPSSGEAHGSLGRISFHFDWDVDTGVKYMRRALELEPTNGFVLHCSSRLLADAGHVADALALTERALALEPTSPLANRDHLVVLLKTRRYEEAITHARRALELDPYDGGTYYLLGMAYEHLRRDAEAIDAYIKPLTFAEEEREHVALLRAAGQRAGLRGYYEQTLAFLLTHDPLRDPEMIATIRLKLGDVTGALDWLDRLYAERWPWMPALKHDPEWDALRTHPRFQRLMARLDEHSARARAAARVDGAAPDDSPQTLQLPPRLARLPQ